MKLDSVHQLLVCADYVNTLGRSVHTIKKYTETLVITGEEIGLVVNAEKTNYMVTSQYQNAGQNRNIKVDNKSFEKVEQFEYLGAALMYQNSIQEEIKSRVKSGNACYHSVQNVCSSLLSKNMKIKIYRTIILPVVL